MKRIFVALLSVILVFSLATVAYADVIIEIDDWSLAKTPGGKAWEIRSYDGTETEIELIDKYGVMNITSLGPNAFANDDNIFSVTMNKSMQGIKEYAFLNSNVSSVKLNSNLLEIDRGAFSGTSNLSSINLEDTRVQDIMEYTFLNSGLTDITLPEVCRTIGVGAFMQCSDLAKVVLDNSVSEIAENAFEGCTSLKSINIKNTSITAVSAYCFAECGIGSMKLPSSCTSIGNNAFYNCSSLRRVEIPDSVTTIADTSFEGCDNLVIICSANSYAAEYAASKGIDFITTDDFVLGDVNDDNNVSIRDVTFIQLHLVGRTGYEFNKKKMAAADVSGDGVVNIRDATYIQLYKVGKITSFDNLT